MPNATLAPQLATRVRAVLQKARHTVATAGTEADWRSARDAWLDRLDPTHPTRLAQDEVVELIGFLSECGPTPASRLSAAQWETTIAALVPELLYARSSSRTQ